MAGKRPWAASTMVLVLACYSSQAASAQDSQATGRSLVMDQASLALLVRSPLTALDQAGKTGNYTVLRDLGGPGFRRNTSARLAEAFASLRDEHLDLSPSLILDPVITSGPVIDDAGRMRLSGYVPSFPRHIQFDIAYEVEDGGWKLYGMAVSGAAPAPTPILPPAPSD